MHFKDEETAKKAKELEGQIEIDGRQPRIFVNSGMQGRRGKEGKREMGSLGVMQM